MDLANKTELIDYLRSHGLYTKHSLGQNFLVDRDSLDKIVDAAEISKDDLIVEVGPGLGTMTAELVKKAGKVVAVELDEKLAGILAVKFSTTNNQQPFNKQVSSGGSNDHLENERLNGHWVLDIGRSKLEVISADILKVNIPELVGDKPYKVVANIPYYITSKIIQLFLTLENKPESIVLLTQKEVAERISAKPGDMSTLSVSVQAYGEPEIVGIVPRTSFFPAPEVDSAILKIANIHAFLPETEEKEFFRLVHIGFASRRKTLVNNLQSGLHIDKIMASDIIKAVGLSENVRAQELSVGQWGALAASIKG